MAVVLDGSSTSPWIVWLPKPSVKEAAPQLLMQDWPGIGVANLVSRMGVQASQQCMLLGILQTTLVIKPVALGSYSSVKGIDAKLTVYMYMYITNFCEVFNLQVSL